MTRSTAAKWKTWEDVIACARGGDAQAARELLRHAAEHLERGEPLPGELAAYIAAAFREILEQTTPPAFQKGAPDVVGVPRGMVARAFKAWVAKRYARPEADANAALNLRPGQGAKDGTAQLLLEHSVAVAVEFERIRQEKSPHRAGWRPRPVRVVAERYGLSERRVEEIVRACELRAASEGDPP